MSSQIRIQIVTRGFGSSNPAFVVFMPIGERVSLSLCSHWRNKIYLFIYLDELVVAGSDCDVLVCAES